MKNTHRIDFLTLATLALMALALPLALLHITSSFFPGSAVNSFYSSLSLSPSSLEIATDTVSKPMLFIIRKPGEDMQIYNGRYLDANGNTADRSPSDTCGNVIKI